MTFWTISRRLFAGFTSLLVVIALLVGVFEYALKELNGYVSILTKDNIPGLILSSEALQNALSYRALTLRHLLTEDPAERKSIDAECETLAKQTLENLSTYEESIWTDDDRALFDKVKPAFEHSHGIAKNLRELNSQGDHAGALALVTSAAAPAFAAYERAVIELTSYNENFARENAANIASTVTRTRVFVAFLGAGAVAVAIAAGMLITRRITRAIRNVSEALDEGSAQVAGAARQISSASQLLAEGSSEQASSLEETSASLEEMSAMTKRNADSAQQAKELSAQTRASADGGAAQMDEMRRAMDAIKASSDDIAKIIKTIDEIAFQTNILALNAAVEAARAGDAGMGFAVVAEEVRSLAQRSAQSAKETATKIEDAIRKSEHGVTISGSVAQALGDIVEKARTVDALVAEIADASKEQSQGIGQLNSAVGQMDKVTQSNASNAEETAAAAEELTVQATTMRRAVANLEILVQGRSRRDGTTRKAPAPVATNHSLRAGPAAAPPSDKRPTAAALPALRKSKVRVVARPAPVSTLQ